MYIPLSLFDVTNQGVCMYDCVTVDECLDGENGGCGQICVNTEDSFYCKCQTGYLLDLDGKTCLGQLGSCLM